MSPKWLGRCPECGEWNSFVEEARAEAPRAAPRRRAAQAVSDRRRSTRARSRACTTGLPGLRPRARRRPRAGVGRAPRRASPGSASRRCSCRPGAAWPSQARDVLYASAEESAPQVRLRGGTARHPRGAPARPRGDRRLADHRRGRVALARGGRDRLGAGGAGAVARPRRRARSRRCAPRPRS